MSTGRKPIVDETLRAKTAVCGEIIGPSDHGGESPTAGEADLGIALMIIRSIAGGVEVLAPAKLNLFLEVLGRRPDGYHEIESLMVAVSLHDSLTFTDDPSGEISLRCNEPTLPVGGDNLVVMAAERLKASAGSLRGARIVLDKAIPAESGLAGGSSDAAATLVALDRLWDLRLPREHCCEPGGGDRQRRDLLHPWTGRGLPRAGRAGGVGSSQGELSLRPGSSAGRNQHGRRLPPGGSTRRASTDRACSRGPVSRWIGRARSELVQSASTSRRGTCGPNWLGSRTLWRAWARCSTGP